MTHATTQPTAAGPVAVLIGPPGAGKTSVGPLLAERLGTTFRETDADIAAAVGRPVSDIFIEQGERGLPSARARSRRPRPA